MAPRSVSDIIDDLGCGVAQARMFFFGGGIYFANGIELTLLKVLCAAIAAELLLDPYWRASMYSAALSGKMVGNFANMMNDTYFARKLPLFVGFAMAVGCVTCIAFCSSHWVMLPLWLALGLGVGFGCPAFLCLMNEATPMSHRAFMNGMTHVYWVSGAMCTLFVASLYSRVLDFGTRWRDVLLWCQLPPALMFAAGLIFRFVDSAQVFVAQGRLHEARLTLADMREQNGRGDVDIDFEVPALRGATERSSFGASLRALFSSRLFLVTLSVVLATFTLNFVSYGCGYAMVLVLPKLDLSVTPVALFACGHLAEIVGYTTSTYLGGKLPRRYHMFFYLGAAISGLVSIIYGLHRLASYGGSDRIGEVCVIATCVCFEGIMAHGWFVVYLYAAEVFPTMCRSTALGVVLGLGRLGSIGAPFVFEALRETFGGDHCFFALAAIVLAANIVVTALVLPETKGRQLQTFLDENEPLKR